MDENSFNHEVFRSADNKSGTDYTAVAALSTVNCKVNKLKKRSMEILLNFSAANSERGLLMVFMHCILYLFWSLQMLINN